ncbi:hypothetical protein [Couchioplanes caeruleus]|uniref:Uncharacterized protein n=2 Tax=Couchioplanes caeruleus TaxID=56438 RepID=A0A1K0GQZ7_9ACTN|nr:hypothetical protein [Couchioplanes caeruleus]OJF11675.1 hypothetical protein BG844_24930 [Couchioplanes caeruleus subsp. caeruleus]ROP27436.1 hypothetical protein EDD30_0107 [Couchioplanes caeruleus]
MGPGRNAVVTLGLLAGLGATVAVPAGLGALLPDDGPAPAGRLEVGHGVALTVPPGARWDRGESRPGTGAVTLRLGSTDVAVSSVPVPERRADFLAHTRHKFARDDGWTPGPPAPLRFGGGVVGERGDLVAGKDTTAGEPGCYGAAVAEGAGAVVVISPVSGCAAVPAEIWTLVESMTFEAVDPW